MRTGKGCPRLTSRPRFPRPPRYTAASTLRGPPQKACPPSAGLTAPPMPLEEGPWDLLDAIMVFAWLKCFSKALRSHALRLALTSDTRLGNGEASNAVKDDTPSHGGTGSRDQYGK